MPSDEVITRYAGNLVELWLRTTDEDFPLDATDRFEWIRPLGVASPSYWCVFRSREELWGRILGMAQLVGAETIKGWTDKGEIEVKLK